MLPPHVRRATALLLFGFVFAGAAQASDTVCHNATATPPGRPSIGLVLSGGGARGYAHLGVLKVLEENRIPVDCIAATSMGAVVGGLYASGMTAQDMEHRLAQVNLADIAFDITPRAELPQSQREDERLYVNNLAFGFGARGFRLPAGLVQGSQLQALLQAWIGAAPSNLSFDTLPIPYRAIATDLQTGDEVVLDQGSLPQAIRASMALPGLFAPTEVNGRTLVDGGLVDNLPVSTAHALGADVVIAVDIGSPLRSLDALASPADVMQQMLGILIHQNVARERGRLDANDVLISPALGSLSFTDFAHADQAIAAGEAAARAALPRLRQLALSPEQYAAWRARHATPAFTPLRVTRIEIHSRGVVPPQHISGALHVHAGDVYDPAAVNKDLLALSTTGDFDTVTQRLVTTGDGNTLVIDARERDWGPNFLLFGLGLSSSSSDEGNFRAHLGYRRPWLTSSGLEGRIDATVGSDLTSIHAELRQPLSSTLGYYVAPYVEYERRFVNLYDATGAVKVTQYALQNQHVGFDFGVPLARLGDFRIGVVYAHGTGVPQYNLPFDLLAPGYFPPGFRLLPDLSGHALALRERLVIDQLDDPQFPRRGYFTELRAEQSILGQSHAHLDNNGGENHASYIEAYGKAIGAASYGRHSINASIEAGSDFGRANPVDPFGFSLGGFQHLSAYAADQLAGDEMAYAQITYMNQLASFNASPIRGLFAGISLEAGNVWNTDSPAGSGPLKKNINFFTSATTAFGPIYLGVAFAPAGRINFYFQLGRTY